MLFASDWAASGAFFRELATWEKSLGEGLCVKHSAAWGSWPKGLERRAASEVTGPGATSVSHEYTGYVPVGLGGKLRTSSLGRGQHPAKDQGSPKVQSESLWSKRGESSVPRLHGTRVFKCE